MEILISLLSFSFIASFTPGPNNILVMSQGLRGGLRSTLAYQAGAGAACFLILAGIVFLGAQAGKIIPALIPAMKYAGAAYMLYLAWAIAFARPGAGGDKPGSATFYAGMLMQFLNPKFYLYMLVLAGALLPHAHGVMEVLLYALFFSGMAVAGMFVWAASGALLQSFFTRHSRAINTIMALALACCAASLVW